MLRQFRRFTGQTEGTVQVVEVISRSGAIATVRGQTGAQWQVYGEGASVGSNAILQGNRIIATAPSMPIIEVEI